MSASVFEDSKDFFFFSVFQYLLTSKTTDLFAFLLSL